MPSVTLMTREGATGTASAPPMRRVIRTVALIYIAFATVAGITALGAGRPWRVTLVVTGVFLFAGFLLCGALALESTRAR